MKSWVVATWAVGLSLAFAEKLPQIIFQNTKDAYCGVSMLLETTAHSDLLCAGKCSSDAQCVAYSRRGSQCVLHNRLCSSSDLLQEGGARYAGELCSIGVKNTGFCCECIAKTYHSCGRHFISAVQWTCFGLSCYSAQQAPRNKADAKADCEKLRAHVLAIETAEEYELVKKLLSSDHSWLNAEQHGTSLTSNGEPVSYTDWDPNYPPADGLCVAIIGSSGKWHGHACSEAFPFMCEK